ncbi:MAG: hypothetical protein Q9180_004069, partial [Flavoplaca navasiana]
LAWSLPVTRDVDGFGRIPLPSTRYTTSTQQRRGPAKQLRENQSPYRPCDVPRLTAATTPAPNPGDVSNNKLY